MLSDKQQQNLTNRVTIDISTILKFYGIDFITLDKNTRTAFIEVFQLGVGYIEKIKMEEISKNINNFNSSLKNEALGSSRTNENKKNE